MHSMSGCDTVFISLHQWTHISLVNTLVGTWYYTSHSLIHITSHRVYILLLGIPYDTRCHISPSTSLHLATRWMCTASLRILICSETSKRSIRLSFWSSERKNEHCQQLKPDKWNFQLCSSQLYVICAIHLCTSTQIQDLAM